jgi:uncharacterized protein YjbI with pentapeptide repeats
VSRISGQWGYTIYYVIRNEETGNVAVVPVETLKEVMRKEPNAVSNLVLINNEITDKQKVIRLNGSDSECLKYISKNKGKKTYLSFDLCGNVQSTTAKLQLIGVYCTPICDGDAVVTIKDNKTTVLSETQIYLTDESSFEETDFRVIDLRNACPDELSAPVRYFEYSLADEIYINNWSEIPYLYKLDTTFKKVSAKIYGLETINTSNVQSMEATFSDSEIETLDISNWNLRKLENARSMFERLQTQHLIIGNHPESSSIATTYRMFRDCICDKIDLTGLDLSNVTLCNSMFELAEAKEGIDLRTNGRFLAHKLKHDCSNPFYYTKSNVMLNNHDRRAAKLYKRATEKRLIDING